MAIVDHSGIPLALCVTSATPHESQLVEETLRQRHIKDKPIRMVGDIAYDSDTLDVGLAKRLRIEVVAPNKLNRKRRTQVIAKFYDCCRPTHKHQSFLSKIE